MADQEVALFDKQTKKFISDLKNLLNDVTGPDQKFVGLIDAKVYEDIIKHFENTEGPTGQWKAWSSYYKKHMEKVGKSGNKILQDTGNLRQRFQLGKYRIKPNSINWFNNAQTKNSFPYAFAHNEGGPKLPRRRFMWLSNNAINLIEKITIAYLEGKK